jgi:N-acetyl-gamma-glutamyl-phosphate reductase
LQTELHGYARNLHNDAVSSQLSVAVVGASGYAGAELVRLLSQHPAVRIAALYARGRQDTPLADEFPHLAPLGLRLTDGQPAPGEVDVAFLALPHGQSAELAVALGRGGTTLIANPGCYPTAALLALAPFARAGVLAGDVIVDAKSGVSGAGRGAGTDFLYTELEGGTKAYGLPRHRHTPEIAQGLAASGADGIGLTFVPHLIPQVRGIIATCYLALADDLDDDALRAILDEAYADEPFVHPVTTPPSSKLAAGSNHAFVHAVRSGPRRAVVVAAIDNLGKGAAGQAVQNMNVARGLPETAGLGGVGVYP